MGKRVNETVYRARWKRERWSTPKAAYFGTLRKAEEWLEKVVKHPGGRGRPNPLVLLTIDSGRVRWSALERPVASQPVAKDFCFCGWCGKPVTETEPGIWKVGEYSVCLASPSRYHVPA